MTNIKKNEDVLKNIQIMKKFKKIKYSQKDLKMTQI